jgi:hypothetical protein
MKFNFIQVVIVCLMACTNISCTSRTFIQRGNHSSGFHKSAEENLRHYVPQGWGNNVLIQHMGFGSDGYATYAIHYLKPDGGHRILLVQQNSDFNLRPIGMREVKNN